MRQKLDQYNTPLWVTQALIDEFPEIRGHTLLDPCCGNGSMAKLLQKSHRFQQIIFNDIDLEAFALVNFTVDPPNTCFTMDATQEKNWWRPDPLYYQLGFADWVVTNPPFNQAGDIVKHALTHARLGVAMLLRATFLEPCKGREWIVQRPPTAILSLPRISFTGQGHDSVPTWWLIWSHTVRPRISVLKKKPIVDIKE